MMFFLSMACDIDGRYIMKKRGKKSTFNEACTKKPKKGFWVL
jgi:hypothetical protein